MPKRRSEEEKILRYRRKLQKLEGRRKYSRIVYSSEDSENSDGDVENVIDPGSASGPLEPIDQNEGNKAEDPEPSLPEPELDPDILTALGEAIEEVPKYGPKIHEKLTNLWLPILRKGINKETKEKLVKEYPIPENCQLLQAPKLNPEISAAIAESTRTRDKRVEAIQQQLGQGIAALNKGLQLLIDNKERLQAIKFISDASRILCDLHHTETEARRKFITPGLDKAFLNIVQDVDRDELLFGNKLSDKIKATKVIEKQGLQIKKPPPLPKTPQNVPSTSRPRQQGNWMGPPRISSNRGGRGGQRGRGTPASRKTQASASTQQKSSSTQSKQPRATGQQ
ncbi:uncharacterized protein LOC142974577 [Anticarsia gemmatalis]|uniref:uncharacterized protein LOC142974577 n=1 Tax=Anticarsia gemmatalis TaxID=129554 RepID=UPI003F7739C9